MKKIDLICINILDKRKSTIIVLIIMIFMMFLINQSIGYARYLYLQSRIYSVADSDKSYWIDLWPHKSIELNDAFKDVSTDEEYLNVVKVQMKELPHFVDISFIGKHQVEGNHGIDFYGYDDSMMNMVNVLIKKGKPVNSENMNKVLISKELSDRYKINDYIYIDKNNEVTEYDTGYMALKVVGVINNAKFLPGIIHTNKNIIVSSYKLFEDYGIYDYLNSAVIRTDDDRDLSDIYNETSPDLGFFKKFEYNKMSGEINYLKKHLTRQLSILIICLVCISGLNFAGLYNKKYEYGVYFLCGARINDIILLSTLKNLILIVLSTVAGYIMTVYLSAISEILNRVYDLTTYTISLFFALAIYFISSIPVYIELKTQNLIQLIKDVS